MNSVFALKGICSAPRDSSTQSWGIFPSLALASPAFSTSATGDSLVYFGGSAGSNALVAGASYVLTSSCSVVGAGETVVGSASQVDPTPYTLPPTPYPLPPTPYTPHPTPYTLHPTYQPQTLHPTPQAPNANCEQVVVVNSAPAGVPCRTCLVDGDGATCVAAGTTSPANPKHQTPNTRP